MRNRWRSVAFGVQGANGRRSTPGAIALTNALLRSAYEEALVTGVSYPGVEAIRVRTSDGEGAIVDLFEQVTGQIWNGVSECFRQRFENSFGKRRLAANVSN